MAFSRRRSGRKRRVRRRFGRKKLRGGAKRRISRGRRFSRRKRSSLVHSRGFRMVLVDQTTTRENLKFSNGMSTAQQDVAYAYEWSLAGFPEAMALSHQFDQYKILAAGVVLKFPPLNPAGVNDYISAGNPFLIRPRMVWARDYDDSRLSGYDVLCQHMGRKKLDYVPQNLRMSVAYPAVSLPAYSGAQVVDNAWAIPKRNQWVDCAYINVRHYGIKMCINAAIKNVETTVLLPYLACSWIKVAFRNRLRQSSAPSFTSTFVDHEGTVAPGTDLEGNDTLELEGDLTPEEVHVTEI